MRFLADEDFPKPLVIKVRLLGHSIKTVQQKNLRGSSDETVMRIALEEKRIILTFDKDFLKQQTKNLQVIVFKFPKIPTHEIALLIEGLLKNLKTVRFTRGKVLKFSKHGLEQL